MALERILAQFSRLSSPLNSQLTTTAFDFDSKFKKGYAIKHISSMAAENEFRSHIHRLPLCPLNRRRLWSRPKRSAHCRSKSSQGILRNGEANTLGFMQRSLLRLLRLRRPLVSQELGEQALDLRVDVKVEVLVELYLMVKLVLTLVGGCRCRRWR
ncbi:hypothetical protein BT96DRAFT_186445 [Gymnopus androsaceus JB14]|uniref:Uncharacterized protein n=1 Tax=Gymnopus androsaceus JB14 TaxID=1447944 RepID=A0A6A4H8Q5_9AGAR|nr:hypothetical protein BT96DRAFT_186445 [Gymnopus androsaceus JB14]